MLCVQDSSTLNFAKRGKRVGQPDRCRGPRSEPARHGEHGGVAAGGSAGGVRRPAARRGEGQASREEEVVPARVFATAPRLLRRSTACRSSASREADFVDLFVERRERTPGVELLVRAKTNRVLGKDDADKLFDKVRKSPAQGKLVVEVKRLSARVKAQAAKAARQPRQATVRLRCLKVELPAKRKAPVELTHVREENPPADDERRFLLTTLPSAADAERTWYGLRWRRLFSRLEVRLPRNSRTGRPSACSAPPPWSSLGAGPPRTGIACRPKFADVELRVLALFAAPQGRAEKPRRGRLPGRRPGWPHANGIRQVRSGSATPNSRLFFGNLRMNDV